MKNITFFNAGAGSGKTYHLTQTLSEVIKNKQCNANEVILTTFTEKAAAEFKAKARETLHAARMHEQANLLSSAVMGTVHSVAYQLIMKYWHYLGVGVELRIMPQEDVNFFISQSLAQIPTENDLQDLFEISENLGFRDEFSNVDYNKWKRDLKEVIELSLTNRIENLEESNKQSIKETFELFKPVEVNIDTRVVHETLKAIPDHLKLNKESKANTKRISRSRQLISLNGYYSLRDFLELKGFFEDLPDRDRNQFAQIDNILEELAHLSRSTLLVNFVFKYIEIVFSLAERSIFQFKKYKEENKLIDFNDMEIMLLKLLEIEAVRKDLKSRYKIVFVDEFQDSSPIQVDIFRKLSEIAEHSYWVGDPKQAIYDFRGTDPGLIEAIIKALEDNQDENNLKIEYLKDSWRSRPEIVDLTNNIFTGALADQVIQEHVALNPIRPIDELPDDDLHRALQHWHFDDDDQRGSYDLLSKHLATEIRNKIQDPRIHVIEKNLSKYNKENPEKNISHARCLLAEDIVVLCRKNDRVKTFAEAIKKINLEVSAEQKGLIKTAEMQLFLAMLNYYLDPNDSLARSTILLLSSQFDSSESLIEDRLELLKDYRIDEEDRKKDDEVIFNKVLEDYFEKLSTWGSNNPVLMKIDKNIRPSSIHLSVTGITDRIITQTGLLEIVMQWDYASQRRHNLETIRSLATRYEERCLLMDIGSSVNGFIEFIGSYDEKSLLQGSASGKEAVNVMTYHKAKGLEWPVVILADLEENHLAEDKLIRLSYFGIHIDREMKIDIENPYQGKSIIVIPYPFGSKNVPDDLRNDIVNTERFKRVLRSTDREMKRLLYVGMTRARDMLITISYRNKEMVWLNSVLNNVTVNSRIPSEPGVYNGQDLFGTGNSITAKTFHNHGNDAEAGATVDEIKVYNKIGPVLQDKPFLKSPSGEAPLEAVKAEEEYDFNFRIELGKGLQERENELGDCLHRAFYLFNPGMDKQAYTEKVSQVIDKHGLKGEMPYPEHITRSIENLYGFLEKTYGTPVKIYKELPLQMFFEEKVFTGSADLLWETEESLILVDYKSFPGKKSPLFSPEHKKFSGRYSGQISRYVEMINNSHPQGKRVKDVLIYYAVIGVIVSLEF